MARTTAVRVTHESAAALRQLSYALSARTGTRVTLGRVLTAAVAVASADLDRTIAALPDPEGDDE